MKVSREKFAENRERILEAAGALFREKGFDGIAVADIMSAAGLTHGGFYGHFASKEELAAEASREALDRAATNWSRIVAGAPEKPLEALIAHYLSPRQRDMPAKACAFPSLAADAARQGRPVRTAFTEGMERLVGVIAALASGRTKADRRRKALATFSEMVGAMVLARAVDDKALSNEILEAASADILG